MSDRKTLADGAGPQRIFDGHNDTLLRLWAAGDHDGEGFFAGARETGAASVGHIDAPRARAGGMNGGFFALFPPDPAVVMDADAEDRTTDAPYFGPMPPDLARRRVAALIAQFLRMARARGDVFRHCRTAAEIDAAEGDGAIAAVMHIEGAEAIGPDLAELEMYYSAGLRSLGLVWSRPNIFGCGVPFKFPSGPDIGAGLSPYGVELVKACEALGVMVDLSHLNEAGFWDVARIATKPLVATHSNVHALCASSRNLTDTQLDAIAESGGVVGLNYAVGFLREDGLQRADTPLILAIRHLDHMLERLGEGGVALGSDFDGAKIPAALGDAAGLPNLVQAMRDAGYGDALIDKICWSNWRDLLARVWGG